MLVFSQRLAICEKFREWCKENNAKVCEESFLTWLCENNALNEMKCLGIIGDKAEAGKELLNQFINTARAIFESQYGGRIDSEDEATISAKIDSEREIHISITVEGLNEED